MLTIRNLTLQEMVFPMEVAYKEGWNPGLYDGAAFFQADPDGFFIAELDGGMVGGIMAVSYGEEMVFIGNHFVLPPFRNKGYGKALWEYALTRAAGKTIGANGLTEGKSFYESYGFQGTGNVIRCRGSIFPKGRLSDDVYSAHDVDFRELLRFDAGFFGVPRESFLRAWLETPAMESLCILKDGEIRGWGCMRRCREGWRLGPVFAVDYMFAEGILRHFAVKTIAEDLYMDIPENNVQAIKLAFSMGMTPLDARLRLRRGGQTQEPQDQIFGFTTLDIE